MFTGEETGTEHRGFGVEPGGRAPLHRTFDDKVHPVGSPHRPDGLVTTSGKNMRRRYQTDPVNGTIAKVFWDPVGKKYLVKVYVRRSTHALQDVYTTSDFEDAKTTAVHMRDAAELVIGHQRRRQQHH